MLFLILLVAIYIKSECLRVCHALPLSCASTWSTKARRTSTEKHSARCRAAKFVESIDDLSTFF